MATKLPAAPGTGSGSYFPALTGLRAIAALFVFICHAVPEALPAPQRFGLDWPMRLAQQGYVGVVIFFVLSGFLITARYNTTVELTGSWFRSYLQNRFARIYPLYFLLTVVALAAMLVHPLHTWYEWPAAASSRDKVAVIFLNLTLTRAFTTNAVLWGLPTAWTLTIEESFYVCVPFLLLGLKRNFRLLYIYPALLLLLGVAIVALCTRLRLPYGLMGSMPLMLSNTFFGRCVEFLLGMGLALWMGRPQVVYTRAKATTIGVVGIIVGMFAMASIQQFLPVKPGAVDYWNTLVCNVLLPLPVVSLLWGLIHERTWLQQLLQTKVFSMLGKSSYAFYLIHLGVIDTFFVAHVSSHWWARLVAYILLSIALYRWVEKPLQLRLRSKRQLAVA